MTRYGDYRVSKYLKLWNYIKSCDKDEIVLSFENIKNICRLTIDHSFLACKKEIKDFGYEVIKISLKDKKIIFGKIK